MPMTRPEEWIAILDFGSQYSQLIARRVRELKVYCEILRHDTPAAQIAAGHPRGIILSGGPASVYAPGAPKCDPALFHSGIPVLGICYGMQLGSDSLGGRVTPAASREYGHAEISILKPDALFAGLPSTLKVWMSHGDRVTDLGPDFEVLARTDNCPLAAVRHRTLPFFGVQFHPEVVHTPRGRDILQNYLTHACGCQARWSMRSFIDQAVDDIRTTVQQGSILCAVSGGVDSTVTAALCARAVGDRLLAVFVDNGLLRKGEAETVQNVLRDALGIRLVTVRAEDRFLAALQGVIDPEVKRKRIGHEFIAVFRDEAAKHPNLRYLAQGTLYPDVIESHSPFSGPSATIKSHHNVGGLPAELGFSLVEPLRFCFKDEVREIGRELGIPPAMIHRQPFPGPGLAVRVVGAITKERLDLLRAADAVVVDEIERRALHERLWQYFAVLLPVQSVGVMGDERTYESTIAIRAVESLDGMTADWARLPDDALAALSNRIINEVRGINRVVYDVSSKPPSTIEWE
jgi:GMP synthase (glutamine-hydrolysing)